MICLFLRLAQNVDSTDFGIVITTQPPMSVNEEKQWEQSQQGDINEKKTLSKLQKLKRFYKAPVTKFWFNVVRNYCNTCNIYICMYVSIYIYLSIYIYIYIYIYISIYIYLYISISIYIYIDR